jgi:invasion protein IalB
MNVPKTHRPFQRHFVPLRISFPDAFVVFCIVALASVGIAWSHVSNLILAGEVRSLALRETARSAQGWQGAGAWQVVCAESSCRAEAVGNGETIRVSAQVANRESGRALLLEVRAPLGVALARGLKLRIRNGETFDIAFARCDLRGCVAPFFPEIYLMTALRHEDAVEFRYSAAGAGDANGLAGPEGEIIESRVPLRGFAAAVSRLR